jgi:hypothetical protein
MAPGVVGLGLALGLELGDALGVGVEVPVVGDLLAVFWFVRLCAAKIAPPAHRAMTTTTAMTTIAILPPLRFLGGGCP